MPTLHRESQRAYPSILEGLEGIISEDTNADTNAGCTDASALPQLLTDASPLAHLDSACSVEVLVKPQSPCDAFEFGV